MQFLWGLLFLEGFAFAACALDPYGLLGEHRELSLVIAIWSLGVVLNLTLHRLAFRLHESRSGLITIVVCVVVSLAAVSGSALGMANLALVLCALVVLDLGSGVLFALYVRKYGLAIAYLAVATAQGLYVWL